MNHQVINLDFKFYQTFIDSIFEDNGTLEIHGYHLQHKFIFSYFSDSLDPYFQPVLNLNLLFYTLY